MKRENVKREDGQPEHFMQVEHKGGKSRAGASRRVLRIVTRRGRARGQREGCVGPGIEAIARGQVTSSLQHRKI